MFSALKPKIMIPIMILLVLVAGIMSIPLIYGYQFKKNYLEFIANINAQRDTKIDLVDYHLGWFESTATFNVVLLPPEPSAGLSNVNVTINQTIQHGPYLRDKFSNTKMFAAASIITTINNEDIEKILLNGHSPTGLAQIHSIVSSKYDVTNEIMTPMFGNTATMGTWDWQGIHGNVNFHVNDDLSISTMTAKLNLGTFNLTGAGPDSIIQQLTISTPTFVSELTASPNHLMNGHYDYFIKAITIKSLPINLVASDISDKHTFATDKNNLLSISGMFDVGRIDAPELVVPMISGLNMSMSVNNLNQAGMLYLKSQYNKMKDLVNPTTSQNEASSIIQKILTPSTTVSMQTKAETTFGMFAITANAHWPANIPAPANVADLAAKGIAELNIQIAAPLIDRLIDKYAEMTPYGAPTQEEIAQQTAAAAAAAENANKSPLNETVASLLEKGQIQLATSLQIMQFGSQDDSIEEFTTDIDSLKLPDPIATELKDAFKAQLALKQAMPTPVALLTPAEKVKAKIAEWVSAGFITKDNTNYTVTITHDAGKVTVNGKPVQ